MITITNVVKHPLLVRAETLRSVIASLKEPSQMSPCEAWAIEWLLSDRQHQVQTARILRRLVDNDQAQIVATTLEHDLAATAEERTADASASRRVETHEPSPLMPIAAAVSMPLSR